MCFAVLCCVWSVCRERILRGFFGCVLCLLGGCVGGSVWGRVGGRGGGGGGSGVGGQGGKGKVRSEGRGTIGSSKERLSVGMRGDRSRRAVGRVRRKRVVAKLWDGVAGS